MAITRRSFVNIAAGATVLPVVAGCGVLPQSVNVSNQPFSVVEDQDYHLVFRSVAKNIISERLTDYRIIEARLRGIASVPQSHIVPEGVLLEGEALHTALKKFSDSIHVDAVDLSYRNICDAIAVAHLPSLKTGRSIYPETRGFPEDNSRLQKALLLFEMVMEKVSAANHPAFQSFSDQAAPI